MGEGDGVSGWATIAAALTARAHAEASAAIEHEMRARVRRRAAEVIRDGGVAAAQIARLVAGHEDVAAMKPQYRARVLGLFASVAEAEAWLGVVRPPERDDRAMFMSSAEAARSRALARAGRTNRDPGPLPPPDLRGGRVLDFEGPYAKPIVDPPGSPDGTAS